MALKFNIFEEPNPKILIRSLYLLALFAVLTCTSCLSTYGDRISRQYTPLSPDTSKKVPVDHPISLYFEGEPIKFDYVKLGLLEVKGDQYASTPDLLDHLKYEALKRGGDAIINVKDGYATRESGILFSKTPPTQYSSHIFTGIAVKLKDSLLFRPGESWDVSFVKKIQTYDKDSWRRESNQFNASIVLTIVLIGVLIYVAATKH